VATRTGVLGNVAVSGQGAPSAAVLACAVFVHGWLAAGWSLPLFHPARLHVNYGSEVRLGSADPLFFRFGYCPAPGGDSPAASPSVPEG
jgi:hypothetical protein